MLFRSIQPAQGEPGKASQIIAKLEQKIPFEGKAKVKLMGLPDKVTAPEREISKADQEIVFPLSVDASVSPGSHKQLFCSVTFKKGDETIVQNIGAGGVLRIVPPKKSAEAKKVASAKP